MKEQYKSDLEKNLKNQTSSENHQNSKKFISDIKMEVEGTQKQINPTDNALREIQGKKK